MGFYPVTPASNVFAIGAPQFPEIVMTFTSPKGVSHKVRIIADNLSENNKYIDEVFVDGVRLDTPFLTYEQIAGSSEIRFIMTDTPSDFGMTSTNDHQVNVTIDTEVKHQTIDNFGASDCWTFQYFGKNAPLQSRERVADLLFSKKFGKDGSPKGIGLSLWRFNIGAGSADNQDNKIDNSWRTSECFADADGNYDFEHKQQGQVWFMKAAKERGCEYLLGFCNSAPYFMTLNGQAYNSMQKPHYNMSPDRYNEFAAFLGNVWTGLKDIHGISLDYVSPFNEPEWGWEGTSQEGSPATVSEMAAFIRCLGDEFKRRGISASIVFPESGAYEYLYQDGISKSHAFFDMESPDYIGNVPGVERLMLGHSYWTSHDEALVPTREQVASEMAKYGLRFWQSEYCVMSNDSEIGGGGGRDLTMNTALYVARLIHHDLVTAGASAWQWWTALSPENYKDGLIYIDKDIAGNDNIYVAKLLWALGSYSRFIRPGAVRTEARCHEKDILVSSYLNEDGSEVVVIQNHRMQDVELVIDSDRKARFKAYLTSDNAEDNMRYIGKVS
ncbi:MAG: glycoside hydrolase, partial [Candidatus Cryptobacteroides sp.]